MLYEDYISELKRINMLHKDYISELVKEYVELKEQRQELEEKIDKLKRKLNTECEKHDYIQEGDILIQPNIIASFDLSDLDLIFKDAKKIKVL